jgi:hypothetical protein
MKETKTACGIFFAEGAAEASETKIKKLSVDEVLLRTPAVISGFLISTFPLSIPVFYLIALHFME